MANFRTRREVVIRAYNYLVIKYLVYLKDKMMNKESRLYDFMGIKHSTYDSILKGAYTRYDEDKIREIEERTGISAEYLTGKKTIRLKKHNYSMGEVQDAMEKFMSSDEIKRVGSYPSLFKIGEKNVLADYKRLKHFDNTKLFLWLEDEDVNVYGVIYYIFTGKKFYKKPIDMMKQALDNYSMDILFGMPDSSMNDLKNILQSKVKEIELVESIRRYNDDSNDKKIGKITFEKNSPIFG